MFFSLGGPVTEVLGRMRHWVVSGINKGLNVCDDVTYSGTVGGALEGVLLEALAVSLQRSSVTMNYSSVATVTSRFHYPQRFARTRKRAGDIDVDDRLPIDQRQFVGRSANGDARVIDQNVNVVESVHGGGKECAHLLLVGHVRGDRQVTHPGRRNLVGDLLKFVRAPRCQHHVFARACECNGNCAANTAARAGNDRNLIPCN